MNQRLRGNTKSLLTTEHTEYTDKKPARESVSICQILISLSFTIFHVLISFSPVRVVSVVRGSKSLPPHSITTNPRIRTNLRTRSICELLIKLVRESRTGPVMAEWVVCWFWAMRLRHPSSTKKKRDSSRDVVNALASPTSARVYAPGLERPIFVVGR
jgi:hypothetical protein